MDRFSNPTLSAAAPGGECLVGGLLSLPAYPGTAFRFRLSGLVSECATMLIRRLQRLGTRVVSELRRGQASSFPRRTYLLTHYKETPQTHCWEYVQKRSFSTSTEDCNPGNQQEKKMISVTFVNKDGEEKEVKVPVGMSILEAAHANDIELEGACEGSLACSTCHVIVMDMEFYNKLDEPVDEENDMLDLAFGLTETSRLGCQIIAKPELDGIRLALPSATRNFAVDGYVPKPH
ncbi:adrenodoxin-like protein 2, mitochondrial isoform X2 [Nymphaea colorata]|uniref:adrenodoxin-like protein 2, mitochondrial isoform X2 n=1 Tax=Nymphaea colorata TaxID=210225 RepID=UPI00129D77CB|nr:adrenodoxin-like protein 2, mitochondrial isoform X2 [Nymphaea colorata]